MCDRTGPHLESWEDEQVVLPHVVVHGVHEPRVAPVQHKEQVPLVDTVHITAATKINIQIIQHTQHTRQKSPQTV